MNANCSITGGDALTALECLSDFLRHLVIDVRSAPADVVTALEKRVHQLEAENGKMLALY